MSNIGNFRSSGDLITGGGQPQNNNILYYNANNSDWEPTTPANINIVDTTSNQIISNKTFGSGNTIASTILVSGATVSIGSPNVQLNNVYTSQITNGNPLSVPLIGSQIVSDTAAQTLTNKTIVNPIFSGISSQSAFVGYSNTENNVTGDGTIYAVNCNNIIAQTGISFSGNTFIYVVPSNGFYLVGFSSLTTGYTTNTSFISGLIINSTNVPYIEFNPQSISNENSSSVQAPSSSNVIRISFTKMLYLTANTTIQPYIQVGGNSSKNVSLTTFSSYDNNFTIYQLI